MLPEKVYGIWCDHGDYQGSSLLWISFNEDACYRTITKLIEIRREYYNTVIVPLEKELENSQDDIENPWTDYAHSALNKIDMAWDKMNDIHSNIDWIDSEFFMNLFVEELDPIPSLKLP